MIVAAFLRDALLARWKYPGTLRTAKRLQHLSEMCVNKLVIPSASEGPGM